MSSPVSLGLTANQWKFLDNPKAYVEAMQESGHSLALESTRRQFKAARDILNRLNGSLGEQTRRGVLLADDVGLGKTTVAALVAWIVASAGSKKGVRILAPNDVMARRWEEELKRHVAPLTKLAKHLNPSEKRVKARRVKRLAPGNIQVVKHSYASADFNLTCDLLIVDEAHRAKGEQSAFSKALRKQKKNAGRVLILTATPFSIHLSEFQRMLGLIGGDAASSSVKAFSHSLEDLYKGNTARDHNAVAASLGKKAAAVVDALSQHVIRHGIDDISREKKSFGTWEDWNIEVPPANANEVELLMRMDRSLRLARNALGDAIDAPHATNDPRFHVGWRHFDSMRHELETKAARLPGETGAVVKHHLGEMKLLRHEAGPHAKMLAVGEAVRNVVAHGEKIVIFCHHHATAQELSAHLFEAIPPIKPTKKLAIKAYRKAWYDFLPADKDLSKSHRQLRETFIEWLCSDLVRSQVSQWLAGYDTDNLAAAFSKNPSRRTRGAETIGDAAARLLDALLHSSSSRAVLKAADERLELIPGGSSHRVIASCPHSEEFPDEAPLFLQNKHPDTLISIFNSPFGPDVLVATDKLSEGVDLHRYCRHMIHYELDPSPIRTVQRNGRLRRVNSWASVTGNPIRCAYPAFPGTRDHRLVQIMKKRLDSFSLLLGGVQDFNVDEVQDSDEQWRNEVINAAKTRLKSASGSLIAKDYPKK